MRRGDAFCAERTFGWRVRGDVEAPQSLDRHVQVRLSAGAIDKHRRSDHFPARRPDRVDRLLHRAPRRHDVVHHNHTFSGSKSESASELATCAIRAALRIDRPNAELPRDLVRQDDAAGGGPGHCVGAERPHPRCDRRAKALGLGRVLEDLELLEVERRVAARREDEVPLAQRARLAKHALDVRRCDGHHDYCAAMKIHDVSLVLRPGMVTWPGEPSPQIEPLRRIAEGDTANVSVVTISDHAGTHVDPPLHFLEGGNTADNLPLEALVGPCVVVAFDGPGHVSGEWLDRAKLPAKTERILFKTPNSARWGDSRAAFTRDFTTINASAARWCVAHGIKLVGIDYLSIEPQGPEKEGYPVHKTLLGADVVIIEGLDLRSVVPGQYELVCAPIKLLNGDGAPARVYLIED